MRWNANHADFELIYHQFLIAKSNSVIGFAVYELLKMGFVDRFFNSFNNVWRGILFIDAVHEVARERAQSSLKPEHQERILKAYRAFADEPGFAKVATVEEVLVNEGNLSIPRYVRPVVEASGGDPDGDLRSVWADFEASGRDFWQKMDAVVEMLDGMIDEATPDA